MIPENAVPLTDGRLLARNTALNLVGYGAPLVVAIAAFPLLVKGVGTERFGILTLAWMVVGYFSLFDAGVGRATTKFVAERLARGAIEELPALIWTSLALLLGLGVLGGLFAAAITPFLVTRVLNIPAALWDETRLSFFLLSVSIPVVLVTTGLRGVLEAQQRFGVINALRIPANTANYLLPLLALPFSASLVPVIGLLVVGRFVFFFFHLHYCLGSLPGLRRPVKPIARHVRELLGFGAWLTVSNVLSPLMTYVDRFVIGALLTMSAVAYYVTPYELVNKLWIISASMMVVLFPAFTAHATLQKGELVGLHDRTIKYVLLFYTPIIVAVIVMARPFIGAWLGEEFARRSTVVMQVLGVGVLVNAVGMVPFHVIQAMGRADLTAKFHLLELPVYLAMIWYFVRTQGINGVAIAWTLRLVLDTGLWLWLLGGLISSSREKMWPRLLPQFAIAGLLLLVAAVLSMLSSLWVKVLFLAPMLLAMSGFSWRYGLTETERGFLREVATRMAGGRKFRVRGSNPSSR
jgi:O-antigen/teichoic acid export membrane protein